MTDPHDVAAIWTPSPARRAAARLTAFAGWLARERGLHFADYDALWRWSVDDLEGFWSAVVAHFDLPLAGERTPVLADARMPGARWYPGVRTNYASQVFRHDRGDRAAIVCRDESGAQVELSGSELRAQVGALAAWLRGQGVLPGDRVVAYLPNIPQAAVAFLACASVGAVWSICSPEMGVAAVTDRFRQIEPKVLIAVDGYRWAGKACDRSAVVAQLRAALPSVTQLLHVPHLDAGATPLAAGPVTSWHEATAGGAPLQITPLPFDHPLWVVYSSGTTGLPKAIVHGHGGVLIEHVKAMALHSDVGPDDRFFWYSTTGWIMWNMNVAALLVGATMCCYDGSPAFPDHSVLWRYCGDADITFFGAGSAYFALCEKHGVVPRAVAGLDALRTVGATGSPLSPESYRWLVANLPAGTWLSPISGGTDFAGAFVAGVVTLPLVAGEMQARCLGARVEAWDEAGRPLTDAVGELVCTAPIPSMPLYFWGDAGGRRLRESYFETYPGVWRHGDWIRITPRGGAVIYGRSDATINRHGVRMGTSELYRVVEALPEVMDSLVVDIEHLGRASHMVLFVVLREGTTLDDALRARLRAAIREAISARHVPDAMVAVDAVPRTLTGKKLEVPVKKLLLGHDAAGVANRDAMANPECMGWYAAYAQRHLRGETAGES